MATANKKEKEVVVVATWNHKEEKALVELMVEQVKKGNRPTTTFSTKAWNEIIDEFYRRTGNKYTKSQFVNKFNKLRLVYREFKKLRDIPTGFGWDPVTKTVTAPDDVWDQYLKEFSRSGMEVGNKKSGPWLVFQHGKRERTQTLFNMAFRSYHVRSVRQMRKKVVKLSFCGWLLLEDSSGRFCLFNPLSLVEIKVPQLTREHHDCKYVLSLPPTDPNCQLILIRKKAPVIYFCRVTEDSEFDEDWFNLEDDDDHFELVVSCKGKIYFLTFQKRFGVIDFDISNHRPTMRFLDVERPRFPCLVYLEHSLVESCGEVFLVCQVFYWKKHMASDFLVFKMDFSHMLWVQVKSIGDRLFFLSKSGSLSCSAFELGLERDQIFFCLEDDISLYSYHMKERSISVDLTCPNVQPPWKSPFWVMHTCQEVMENMRHHDVHVDVDMEKVQPMNTHKRADGVKVAKGAAIEKIPIDERPWSDLPIEIVMLITTSLTPVAYARMRSICKSWRSIVPPAWSPLTPCLIFQEEIDGLYKFFDPLRKRVYAANIPELHGATFHCSKGGWLLVSLDDRSSFFFNPFTRERINLPEAENLKGPFSTMSFSSIPTSPDCVVFAIWNHFPFDNILISTCIPGAQIWHSYIRWKGVHPLFQLGSTNPIFYNGLFYCLGLQGNLGVYNVSENTWNVLKEPKPLQLPIGCCFLIEHEGELILVYTHQTQIVIFTLDQSNMVWVEVEGLKDLTLFLSTSASFAMKVGKETTGAIRDMKNKIFCSRFRRDSDDALIYSMESKSHQLDFYRSKEFLKCTWIELPGLKFGLDSQGNILSVTSIF